MFRILIAEDDPSTARLLCAIVKRAGYEPLIAADGVQALEMLDHNHIDQAENRDGTHHYSAGQATRMARRTDPL